MNTPKTIACLSLFALALGSVHAEPQTDLALKFANEPVASSNAYVLEMTQPTYPMAMLERGIQGKVTVKIVVSESGDIEDVSVVAATQPEFGEAAVKAAREWMFEPARRHGRAVSQTVLVPVSFVIENPMGKSRYDVASL